PAGAWTATGAAPRAGPPDGTAPPGHGGGPGRRCGSSSTSRAGELSAPDSVCVECPPHPGRSVSGRAYRVIHGTDSVRITPRHQCCRGGGRAQRRARDVPPRAHRLLLPAAGRRVRRRRRGAGDAPARVAVVRAVRGPLLAAHVALPD